MATSSHHSDLAAFDQFVDRHIGPNSSQQEAMLQTLRLNSLDDLIHKTVPASILKKDALNLGEAISETSALQELKTIAQKNQIFKSYIGMGYHPTTTPLVIKRNVLENPGWYTAYTPYQAEIAQGRLEGLLLFQQMIMDLTGMEMANASLLDEATASAEAMAMSKRQQKRNKSVNYIVDENIHPQTLSLLKTRAEFFGFTLIVGKPLNLIEEHEAFGVFTQYPGADGSVMDLPKLIEAAHSKNALVTVAADILALVHLESPGQMGADIVVGSSQRFGVPMGFGGPHAAFFAFREAYKRQAPGRIIGVSVDRHGRRALRMAMQTREQHIRREKANSNICTSQVLLALISAFYSVYHGPEGLKKIAKRVHGLTRLLASGLKSLGFTISNANYFDTLTIACNNSAEIYQRALDAGINLAKVEDHSLRVSLHENCTIKDIQELLDVFSPNAINTDALTLDEVTLPTRSSTILNHESFNQYHSETDMLRFLHKLESKDIALNESMIALGSCTMKLNATAEMIPITWPEFAELHPFAPKDQTTGYQQLLSELSNMLKACTGYDAISLQPNAGSQGEYAGLIVINKYFQHLGQHRTICLIPSSAHGTNPASAQMAGLDVVVVECDNKGNVDLSDLDAKIAKYGEKIAAIMITYPSTHGVFEEHVVELCEKVHAIGAQVYIDGANMNAVVGLAEPGKFGGDVSHLNLHKTFCIPHGGGGPGMGPIGVKSHLAPFLPSHPVVQIEGTELSNGVISAAPWGSASILPISWMYIRMMGQRGMKNATEVAILNANYVAVRLQDHYPILYRGEQGYIAHECLLDLRPIKASAGITEEDIAKRLMDYGFHAPTMSFPVAGTLMVEPTESESLPELDRFCDAMIAIREEIRGIENGTYSLEDNPLVNAPHTLHDALSNQWPYSYSRELACTPAPWLKHHKVWPTVNRIDNVFGDRNLVCSCIPIDQYR